MMHKFVYKTHSFKKGIFYINQIYLIFLVHFKKIYNFFQI